MNFAVALVPPAVDTDWPMPRASEEENASTIIIPGWCRSRPCLDSSLNMTPELEIITSDEMSYLSGDASRARSIGLAKASPTIAMALTPSRSMVASISEMSSGRDERERTRDVTGQGVGVRVDRGGGR